MTRIDSGGFDWHRSLINSPILSPQAEPRFIRRYPVFQLSDGSLASKLGLEFKVEAESFAPGGSQAKRINRHFSNRLVASGSGSKTAKQYRIKCEASMEKNIYNSKSEIHLGTSKQTSGLHLSGNSAFPIHCKYRVFPCDPSRGGQSVKSAAGEVENCREFANLIIHDKKSIIEQTFGKLMAGLRIFGREGRKGRD